MAKTSLFLNDDADLEQPAYSDAEYVQGLLTDRKIQKSLYQLWESYFERYGNAVLFQAKNYKKQIVHNAYLVLWNKVRNRLIYVENGVVKNSRGVPFTSNLTTYLMGVAKKNYRELVRDTPKAPYTDEVLARGGGHEEDCLSLLDVIPAEAVVENPFLDTSAETAMRDIVAGIVAQMSVRCRQILTKYYYEEKKMDRILEELPTFSSKSALTTAKNKCMDTLKQRAREQYRKYLNA